MVEESLCNVKGKMNEIETNVSEMYKRGRNLKPLKIENTFH